MNCIRHIYLSILLSLTANAHTFAASHVGVFFRYSAPGRGTDSLVKVSRTSNHPVSLVIKVENQAGQALSSGNMISVSDSALERSFPVNRVKDKGIVKVRLPRPGVYKVVLFDTAYRPYDSWLRIGNVKSDSILITLVPQNHIVGRSFHQVQKVDDPKAALINNAVNTGAYHWKDLLLVLLILAQFPFLIFLQRDVKKLVLKLNREIQQVLFKKASTLSEGKVVQASAYHLSGEVMITAGPRKKAERGKNNDIDLGEDVCGLAISKDSAWFWLLDGTSDQSMVLSGHNSQELFSSRLLAQSLAIELKELMPAHLIQPEILYDAIERIRLDWLKRMLTLPPEESKRLGAQVAHDMPICSSTILIGSLNADGLCRAYRSGDSKMLVFGGDSQTGLKNPLKDHPGNMNDRLFFRLTFTEQQGFEIQYNRPKIETFVFQSVDKVIAYSDGVGSELQEYLHSQIESFSEESRRLLPYLRNMTSDDKSLCILERIKDEASNQELYESRN